jgi:hypothetical protein
LLKVAKIEDLSKVPDISDPDHVDVKTILFIYSMESFLYTRVNKASRDYDINSIKNLGPFAVALTRIINQSKRKRLNPIKGEFMTYRGLQLPEETLTTWNDQGFAFLDGYSSTSRDLKAAKYFAL